MCEEAGIQLDTEGKGLCPFHDDHDPSFRIRRDDDGVERWHCWPCGFGGDVYDLLMRLEGLSFPRSLEKAEELYDAMPPGWLPTVQLDEGQNQQRKEGPDDWIKLWQEGRALASQPQNDGMLCVVTELLSAEAEDATRRRVDRFIRDGWGWGLDARGNVLIPHFDEAGNITGIKVRALGGFKWSRPGSRFGELYGSWQPRRHRNLLLCEGESDAVWAALQGPNADVRALPAGAGKMDPRFVEQARTWDVVYLAFDADHAGADATRRWLAELGGKARVCRLPRGHDLRSVRPHLEQLLAEAITPTPVTQAIAVQGGQFVRMQQNGQRPMTSWYADPIARLIPADHDDVEPAIELEIHYAGRKTTDVIRASDMQSSAKMKQWAGRRSIDCVMGDQDVQLLQSFLHGRAQVTPDVYQTPRVGIHRPPSAYRYAGSSLVLPDGYEGKLPWRFVGPNEIRDRVHLSNPGAIRWAWLERVLELNFEEVMHPIIAWFAATARREEIKHFPLMFIGGPSGAGKSTVAQLLCKMFGSSIGAQLGAITAFPLLRMLASTTTLPVFIDEWSRQSRQDTREAFQGAIPIIYEGGIAERGRADQTVAQYRCLAPIVVAGEDTFSLDREQDRMCAVEISAEGQDHDALRRLTSQPIQNFGSWYYRWALSAQGLPPMPDPDQYNRPEYNLAVLRAGWQTLSMFLEHSRHYDPRVPYIPAEPFLASIVEQRERHENEYEVLLREALALTDSNHNELAWVEPGIGTWVRFRAIASPDVLRRVDVNIPGGAVAMRRYFETCGYTVEGRRVSLPLSKRTMHACLVRDYFPKESDDS